MNDRRPVRTALVILAVHNLVQNSLLNQRGYVSGNLVVSGMLVAVGRAAGLGWDEMGLRPGDVRRSVRIGAQVSAATAAMAVFALGRTRRTTGSILAPWLIHAAFNSLSYLAGVIAVSLPAAPRASGRRSP